jgi:hypothetical protein
METDHWELIDRLAAEMGVKSNARRMWRVRGVPHRYRWALAQTALEAHGIALEGHHFEPRSPLTKGTQAGVRPQAQPTAATRRRRVA